MSEAKDRAMGILKDTWYLWAIVAVCAVGAVVLHGREKAQPAPPAYDREARQAALDAFAAKAPEPVDRRTPADRAREVIESHRQRVEANPESEEAPALLAAMGNLARQKLGDYALAAQYYEQALEEYPDWDGINRIYLNLATCYEQLGRQMDEVMVYKKMRDAFPEDTVEHQFAKAQLGG